MPFCEVPSPLPSGFLKTASSGDDGRQLTRHHPPATYTTRYPQSSPCSNIPSISPVSGSRLDIPVTLSPVASSDKKASHAHARNAEAWAVSFPGSNLRSHDGLTTTCL